jgi:phosphonate transport system substrate-binding protein
MKRLVFGTGPIARNSLRAQPRRAFAERLAERIGVEVVVVVASSYAELSGLVCRGEAQVAWLPPAVYVRCQEQADVTLMLGAARAGGVQFAGALFVKADAPWTTLAELEKEKLSVAWVDHDSCAGYLFPRLALEDRGMSPDRIFQRQFVLGSHNAVARAVEVGRADVGATFIHGAAGDALMDGNVGWSLEVDRDLMRPILLSAPIPADVICGAPTLDPDLREQVTEALIVMHETPDGRDVLQGLFDVDRFVSAQDEDYELVRRAMAAVHDG